MWKSNFSLEFRFGETNFEYRYIGTIEWIAIAPIEDLRGPQGEPGTGSESNWLERWYWG